MVIDIKQIDYEYVAQNLRLKKSSLWLLALLRTI